MHSRCCVALSLCLLLLAARVAEAQVRAAALARINLLNKKAMEEYDSLEFEAAKDGLLEALGVAESAKITSGRALTTTQLNLGVVYGAGLNDRLNAIKYFSAALRIDRSAQLNPARATPALEEMFQAAQEEVKAEPPRSPTVVFRHTPVDEATSGRAVRIRARASAPNLARVALFVRGAGGSDFRRILLRETRPGSYSGLIPAELVGGGTVYYYLEAQDAEGARVAGHGTAASPNVISVQGGAVRPPPPPPAKRTIISIAAMAGIGFGIVNGGESEHEQPQVGRAPQPVDINPGGALAPFHIAPEVAYHINNAWHVGVLGRIQVVNAISEPSKVSWLGLARAKRYFGSGDLRFFMAFGAGAGQIRHRIPLGDYDRHDGTPNDLVDTRVAGIVAFGLGGGVSYMFTRNVGAVVELNGLIVVPAFAANLDLNLGMVLAF